MKKSLLYPLLILFFAGAIVFIFLQFKNKESRVTSYEFKERKFQQASTQEYTNTRKRANELKLALQENPDDKKALLGLSTIFIQEGRITGDHLYYDKAAMHYINQLLKLDSNNFDALTYKAILFLSQHHFSDGLAIAQKAQKINPYNAFIYGVLIDANVELGNYDSAIMHSDTMMSIRPDIRSYARVSYIREIFGDYPGATEAMQMAAESGLPGDEGTEWTRVQLGQLYEKTGDLLRAKMHYTIALDERPNYAYAYSGLARLATAEKNYPEAIRLYLKADSLVNDFAIKEELSEVYTLAGQNDKSLSISKRVVDDMSKVAEAAITDENIGHYSDRELAYAYLKVNDNERALKHAIAEWNRRPKNVDVNETVAWVYYKMNQPDKSVKYITEALKTNSKNPVLLSRAGLVYLKLGDKAKAKSFLEEALKHQPNFTPSLKAEASAALATL